MTTSTGSARLLALATPTVLGWIAVATVSQHPRAIGGWVIAGLALCLTTVGLFDLPLDTRARSIGLVRRCLGRTHVIAWEHVVAIEIGRRSVAAVTSSRRRYMLSMGTGRWLPNESTPTSVVVRSQHRGPGHRSAGEGARR